MPSIHETERLLPCLAVVLLVTAGVPAVAVSAGSADDGDADFTRNVFVDHRGDVAAVSVSLSGTDAATLRIAPDDRTYSATVVLTDEDGDGRATALLNTYDLSYRAGEGDALAVREASNATGPLAVGTYELVLWPGERPTGTGTDVATLGVHERATERLRTLVARESVAPSNLTALLAARASGNLTPSGTAVENGTLVLELRASGLEGALAAADGSNATARFGEFFESEAASLVVRDLPGPEQERAYLDVTDPSATTVVADARNDTYYLVVDLRDVPVTDGHGGTPANNRDTYGEYRATVTLRNASALAESNESAVADFRVAHRRASVETTKGSDRVFLASAPNQTVSGRTTLPPGTRVTVRIHGERGDAPDDVVAETTRVENASGDGHRFAARFDLGGESNRTRVTVTVEAADGTMLVGSRTGEEGTSGWIAVPNASVNLTDRGLTESGVLVERASLSHGGYVAVHRGSADGEVLARSERLAPDEEFGQFLEFDAPLDGNATLVAVAHRDGPGDSLGVPYTENGSIVSDSVRYTTTPETTTRTTKTTTSETTETVTTTTESPMRGGTDAPATTGSPTRGTTDAPTPHSDGTVPGFGVGAALVALLAGLALARKG